MEKINTIYNKKNYTIKIGDKFNRLTILNLYKINGKFYCDCKCDCENIKSKTLVRDLLSDNTKSCGCLNKELRIQQNTKHNDANRGQKTRLYNIWVDMRRRCNNKSRKSAKNYSLKGITVCEEWNDYLTFKEWAMSNGYNDDLTIERKDNSKGYNPNNCCWIPKSEQSRNRTTNHYITYNGKTQTLTEWALELNIKRTTLSNRLRNGWSVEKAFEK